MNKLPDDLHNCVLISAGDYIFVDRLMPEERDYLAEFGNSVTDPFGSYSQQDTMAWLDLLELSKDADPTLHVNLWIMRKAGAHLATDRKFGLRLYCVPGEQHGWFKDKEMWQKISKLLLAPRREKLLELLQATAERREKYELC